MRTSLVWISTGAFLLPAQGATYLSVEQAQQAIFPGGKFTEAHRTLSREQRKAIETACGLKQRSAELRAWRVDGGGWFLVDEVIGKHEFITFAVGITPEGAVSQVEVMDYRENYGDEIRRPEWRRQFVGKRTGDSLEPGKDITNISGATLSCRHVTEGVKRLLAAWNLLLKP
ncbi:MAG: FMN-binding protein [Verrucomicrobiota bacterium]